MSIDERGPRIGAGRARRAALERVRKSVAAGTAIVAIVVALALQRSR